MNGGKKMKHQENQEIILHRRTFTELSTMQAIFFGAFLTLVLTPLEIWQVIFITSALSGFISGKKMFRGALVGAGSIVIAWAILYLLLVISSNFIVLEVADVFMALALGMNNLGILTFLIALLLGALAGATSGAFGSSLFGVVLELKTSKVPEN